MHLGKILDDIFWNEVHSGEIPRKPGFELEACLRWKRNGNKLEFFRRAFISRMDKPMADPELCKPEVVFRLNTQPKRLCARNIDVSSGLNDGNRWKFVRKNFQLILDRV